MDDRAVETDKLAFGDDRTDVMLFFEDDIRDVDRLRAKISAVFLVCERARCGMIGAASVELRSDALLK